MVALVPQSPETGPRTMPLFLRACPRCGGAVAARADEYGDYLACLQCGRTFTTMELPDILAERKGA